MNTSTADRYSDLGPLTALMQDETVGQIMVNGDLSIYAARQAFVIDDVADAFRDESQLMEVIARLLAHTGHVAMDGSIPIIDRRLPDGTRVHVILPPVAVNGPALTIVRPPAPSQLPTWETLIRVGSVTPEMLEFLRACVGSRTNVVVSGGTGSGKTTLLNLLANMIRPDARVLLVEPESNLLLPHKNLVRLEARPADAEGRGKITMRQLVDSARKMRPDRILVSEVAGVEALPVLEAMSTGVEGSMFAIHATGPRDALNRLEIMVTAANPALPLLSIRQQIANALSIVVHIDILQDGWRRLVKISEVAGMAGDIVQVSDIIEFVPTGTDEGGKITGNYTPTGYTPRVMQRITNAGISLPDGLFGA
jgi:pilus assembly protein CpaF